jgi:hypothetical protein
LKWIWYNAFFKNSLWKAGPGGASLLSQLMGGRERKIMSLRLTWSFLRPCLKKKLLQHEILLCGVPVEPLTD